MISEDVFPEIATKLRRLENPRARRRPAAAVGFYLKRADRSSPSARRCGSGWRRRARRPSGIRVIPNWIDTTAITPQPRENEWARPAARREVRRHALGERRPRAEPRRARPGHDLPPRPRRPRGRDHRLRRPARGDQSLAARLEADNVRFLPYQPREVLPLSLAAANLHFVGLARGLSGYVVPSRLYGILAAGRPVIVAADADSETAQVVAAVGCGVVVPPGRPELRRPRDPRRLRRQARPRATWAGAAAST